MAEIVSIAYYPAHTRQWIVTGAFRSIGNVQINFELPDEFKDALIKLAQINLDKKEAELRCELLGEKPNDHPTHI